MRKGSGDSGRGRVGPATGQGMPNGERVAEGATRAASDRHRGALIARGLLDGECPLDALAGAACATLPVTLNFSSAAMLRPAPQGIK